jgi:uncharacterized membrane protein YraQ (UPF0718 family)
MKTDRPKQNKRDLTPLILFLVVVILAVVTWVQGGISLALEGMKSGGMYLINVLPLLIAAFLTAGMIQALVDKNLVEQWLGSESGWRGLFFACLGGALIPGGPYVYYPIAAVLLHSGAGIGVLIAFITAKNLWSVSRIPLEMALLGSNLTFVRYGITFLIPPLLGYLAEKLFGKYTAQIREGAPK